MGSDIRLIKLFDSKAGRCAMRANHYSSQLQHFEDMFTEAQKHFPELTPHQVEIVFYAGERFKRVWGIEWNVPAGTKVSRIYERYSLEETLTPRMLHWPKMHKLVLREIAGDKHCVLRTLDMGNTLQKFRALFAQAKHDYPSLQPADVKIENYAGNEFRHTFGIEFDLPQKASRRALRYKAIPQVEMTL